MSTKSKIYKNMLEPDEIRSIIEFYSGQTEVHSEEGIINKNLEYHIPENFIYQLLYPKLCSIFSEDHVFDTGSYKSSSRPYVIHVDSWTQHNQYSNCMSFGTGIIKHNKAVLVPLVEGDEFRTITFLAWSDYNPTVIDLKEKQGPKNTLVPEDFTHDLNFYLTQNLRIDIDYHWRLGDILVWDRNQWHMSSDFWKFGKRKNFLVLFIE